MAERLQKFLAKSGIGSRRYCEELIKSKKIKVNGQIALIGATVNRNDEVELKKLDEINQFIMSIEKKYEFT